MKTFTQTCLIALFTFAPWITLQANSACQAQKIDTWTQAKIAQSGDTLLVEGRQLKLAGVYAPDMGDPSKRSDPPRPLSRESQTFLNRLLANNQMRIGIEYDEKKMDEFGRPVAHVFLEDGRNISELILEAGMGISQTNPPNLAYQACYYAAEQRARQAQRGLWRLPTAFPDLKYPVAPSQLISDADTGYRIYRGEVRKVSRSRNNYIINLDTTGIRIQRDYWPNFDYAKLEALQGQTIEVRGYGFTYQGAMYVVIQHPNVIDKLNPTTQP
jgi:endonuclease YncB( thermonuclease family)